VNLTMPSIGHGVCRILVNGHRVGVALGRYHDWQAQLWPVPDATPDERPYPCRTVVERRLLRDLRAELRRRLDEDGPWWTPRKENS